MSDNPIRRRATGHWSWVAGTTRVRARRTWVGVCPDCGEEVRWSGGLYGSGRTRKNTKDALHRHRVERHRLGLVGRSDAGPLSVA